MSSNHQIQHSFIKRYREGHEDMIATLDELPVVDVSDIEETFRLTTKGEEADGYTN